MPIFLITPRYLLADAKTKFDCDYAISIGESCEHGTSNPATPPGIDQNKHFRFYFDDLCHIYYTDVEKNDNAPSLQDIKDILEVFRKFPEDAKVLVHCQAGYSRSPAAVFIALCDKLGDGNEKLALEKAEDASVFGGRFPIMPNARIVKLADDFLGRGGKMIKALDDYRALHQKFINQELREKDILELRHF